MRIGAHHIQISTDHRCEIGFIDYEQVALRDPWSAFTRNFFAGCNIDDVNRQVAQFRAKRGSEVVSAALNEDHVSIWEPFEHSINRFEVNRGILANGGMRAAARFNTQNALCGIPRNPWTVFTAQFDALALILGD